MSNKAWISVGVFFVLLVLVVVTREDRVAVGIRTLELPTLDTTALEKIEVTGKHKATLEKGASGWTVSDPAAADKKLAAEQSLVSAALDALAELDAGAFVTARKEKHAELEIDDEKGLFVTLAQKGAAPLSLVFGRAAQGGGNYVRLAGSDEVFVGKGRGAALLSKDVSAWRKKKLFDVEAKDLVSVVVEPAGEAAYGLEARQAGEGESPTTTWSFAAGVALPEGFRADEELIKRVGSTVASLRAADFVDDDKPEAETGLGGAPATGRVVVKTADGKSLAVSFGKEDDKKRYYAKIDGEEQVYLLPSYQVSNVVKPLAGLRDLTLVRFDAAQVERLAFDGPSGAVALVKTDGAWSLVSPAAPPAGYEFDPGRVDGALASLSRLKGQERLEDAPAGTGLEAPATWVKLGLADGSEKLVAFGADVPGEEGGKKVYVRGAEEPNVYVVPQFQKTRFDQPLDLFKKLAAPPTPPPGGGGMIPGMENLPPDVRKKLEESLRQQGMPGR